MDRRRYLATIGALGLGSAAGCVAAPSAGSNGSDATNGDGHDHGDHDQGNESYDPNASENGAYVTGNFVELDLWDRFVLDDQDIALIATETDRRPSENLETPDPEGRDVYVIRLSAANEGDERAELEHELFWLEGLDPNDSTPDTELSEQFEHGAAGPTTSLDPGEERTLEIAFAVPDDLEPRYLWVKEYYVCLVED